jgi:L-ascorbate metabolism protein UlaG (beta-lactamase superfamily)
LLIIILGCTLTDFGLAPEEYQIKISWLGHAGFLVENEQARIYINPYSAPIGSLKGDAILVSYTSSDLCDVSSINTLSKDISLILAPPGCSARLVSKNLLPFGVGRTYNINGVIVETVDAYNLIGSISKGDGVGFTLTINETIIYYTGITDVIPEMNKTWEGIDILIFPIAGQELTMDINESIGLMKLVNATYNIPMYYGGNTGTAFDVGREVQRLARAEGINVTLLGNQDLLIK